MNIKSYNHVVKKTQGITSFNGHDSKHGSRGCAQTLIELLKSLVKSTVVALNTICSDHLHDIKIRKNVGILN